jgi:thiamine biosynthesis lipoprotein ApbE
MVPFALLVILPTVLAGYVIGKIIFTITHRRDSCAESDAWSTGASAMQSQAIAETAIV